MWPTVGETSQIPRLLSRLCLARFFRQIGEVLSMFVGEIGPCSLIRAFSFNIK